MAPLYGNVAMIKAVPDAVRAAAQAFKTGMRVPLDNEIRLFERGEESPQLGAAQLPYGQSMGPDWGIWRRVASDATLEKVAHFIGAPGKSANFIHTFYKVLSERASATTIAFEKAALEGKSGSDFWNRYQYHYANPTDEALRKSVTDAYTGAFMAKLGEKGEAVARAMNLPGVKWLFPFNHIPINMTTMSVEYAGPLAMLDKTTRAAVMGKLGATAAERNAAQNLAIAKMVVGGSIMTYFMHKGLSGEATGEYPLDPEERRRWQLLGIQPNSIKIGGQWVSMERLGPAGNVAMIGANLGQVVRNYHAARERGEGIDDAITAAIWGGSFGTAKILGTESGLQSLHNIMSAMEDPKEAMKFLRWQVGSMIPASSMASQAASYFDPYMRQTNSIIDALKYRLPGARGEVPAKLDPAFGEPVPNPGYHRIFRGVAINTDPMRAEMDRAGYYPAAPQPIVKGVHLTPEQHDKQQAVAGVIARQMMDAVLQSPGWAERTFAERHEAIKKVFTAARKGGDAVMVPEIAQEAYQQRYDYLTGKTSTPRPKTSPPLTAPGLVPQPTTPASGAPIKPGEPFRPGLPAPATKTQMQQLPPPATTPGGSLETPETLGIRG
jgi:hypothetical protein